MSHSETASVNENSPAFTFTNDDAPIKSSAEWNDTNEDLGTLDKSESHPISIVKPYFEPKEFNSSEAFGSEVSGLMIGENVEKNLNSDISQEKQKTVPKSINDALHSEEISSQTGLSRKETGLISSDHLQSYHKSGPEIPYPSSPTDSTSSLSSSDSTHKLINNLSENGLGVVDKQTSALEEKIPNSDIRSSLQSADTTNSRGVQISEQNEVKKPIKFTVRKVSREGIASPGEKRGNKKPVSHRYGNLPENQDKIVVRKPGDRESQLKHNQAKYDQYVTRIEKIDKEIRFLTTLLPPYNVEIDYSTRTKITRAIEKLGSKKDEVEKKKYELGMSISRFWREFDENNTWVRSVSKN
ncbi:hypothetical protein JCM33374_g6406 [Metschnikowia sp. JCM 33374]|nr:hypothetical protein JCM33374_g6406 [Metschnikowia sp. JCM 33374]